MRCLTLQQPSWMMSMSEGLLLGTKPTAQDGIYPLLLQNPRHSPLPFCAPLLQTSHSSARMVNTSAQMINTMRSFQRTLGSIQFIWEHLNDINRVLQHVKKARRTFSGWKMDVCIP